MPVPVPVPPSPYENILKQLVNYDVIILMDDSYSMRGTRWKQARNAPISIIAGTDHLRIRQKKL